MDYRNTDNRKINIRSHSQGSRSHRGMRSHSQLRRHVGRRNILSTRGLTRKATWNARTIYEQGMCANISKEIEQVEKIPRGIQSEKSRKDTANSVKLEYNIEVLGLCETMLVQAGQTFEIKHRRYYHLLRT